MKDQRGATSDEASVQPPADQLRKPGAGTLVSSSGLDHPCDGEQGAGCSLTGTQRFDARLGLLQRIAHAGTEWGLACLELRIEKLLERDEPEPLLVLLLDVVSSVATGGISGALKRVGAHPAIDGGMRGLMRTAVANVRPLLAVHHERDRVRRYLETLSAVGAHALQVLTDQVLAKGTDEELLAWRDTFDSSRHSAAFYRHALEAQIASFEKSGVTDLGDRAVPDPTKGTGEILVRRAKAAWLVYPNGARELAIVSTDYESWADGEYADRRGEFYDARDDSFGNTKVRPLAPEFVEIAMSEHARTWHEPPRDIPIKAGVPTMQLHDVRSP